MTTPTAVLAANMKSGRRESQVANAIMGVHDKIAAKSAIRLKPNVRASRSSRNAAGNIRIWLWDAAMAGMATAAKARISAVVN